MGWKVLNGITIFVSAIVALTVLVIWTNPVQLCQTHNHSEPFCLALLGVSWVLQQFCPKPRVRGPPRVDVFVAVLNQTARQDLGHLTVRYGPGKTQVARLQKRPLADIARSVAELQIDQDFLLPASLRNPNASGDLFRLDKVPEEPVDSIFNTTFSSLIHHYPDYTGCQESHLAHRIDASLRQLLHFWGDLARQLDIPYLFAFGTLLGYARNKDVVPFDEDADVLVPSWVYWRLLPYAELTPAHTLSKNGFALSLHPEFPFLPVEKRNYYTCDRKISLNREDSCAYSCLLGRLHYNGTYVDLFATDHLVNLGQYIIREDWALTGPSDVLFPPRRCRIAGVDGFCPNNYRAFLWAEYTYPIIRSYKDLLPRRICFQKQIYQRHLFHRPDLQKRFFEQDILWEKRFGSNLVYAKPDEACVRPMIWTGYPQICRYTQRGLPNQYFPDCRNVIISTPT